MKQRAAFWLLFSGVIVAALFLRCGDLSFRPLHNDEAINAFKLRKLWSEGEYRYDPHEYHGPTLYYLSLPVLAVAARFQAAQPDEVSMRSVPLAFGVLLILVPLIAVGGLGRSGILFAGLLTAVSPAFVYFSRYYIHELLLVFFSAVFLAGLWRYRIRPGAGWAAMTGAALALMYATKETFVFTLGATACGLMLSVLGPRGGEITATNAAETRPGGALTSLGNLLRGVARTPWSHVLLLLGVASVVALLFFTSFFSNPGGALDALKTYLVWFQRAGGATPHVHPWYFYFQRLVWFRYPGGPVWSELEILVFAMVGMVAGWRGGVATATRGEVARFLTGFSLSLAAVYAVLPYKTPWCLLGFHHGLILLAGLGLGVLWEHARGLASRATIAFVVLGSVVHLGLESRRASGEFAADFRNPHVYGHTSQDIFNLLEQVRDLAAVHAEGRSMPIEVVAPDDNYWPLPWYLRDFSRVGWGSEMPVKPTGAVLVVASKLRSDLEEKSGGAWIQAGMFELRPRFFVEVYVESGLWKQFLARRAAPTGSR